MRNVMRMILVVALLATMILAPAAGAQADEGAEVISVVESECPEGYSGTIFDFYVGEPPRHVFTLRACQNIIDP